jgi:predicted component of type VI protein secretion system
MLLRHSVIVVMMESVAMSEHRADTPEQVLKFVPKEWPNSYGSQVEEVGQAIVTKIQRAADLSNENCDRALALAHKLSIQLRTAEDRISQLEAEVELFRDRAARAERWLQTIQNEIEEKLIAPRSAITAEQTPLPKDAEL